jgi:hypothetical protein
MGSNLGSQMSAVRDQMSVNRRHRTPNIEHRMQTNAEEPAGRGLSELFAPSGEAFAFSYPEAVKQLGTCGESPYELLRRGKRVRVEVLWETAKAETTLRNGRDAGKRWNGSPSPNSLRTRLRLAKDRRRGNRTEVRGQKFATANPSFGGSEDRGERTE